MLEGGINMKIIPDNELDKVAGGNKVEDLCKKPLVSFILNFAKKV